MKMRTKDPRYILPGHLVHYQKDKMLNKYFRCRHLTLYVQAMEDATAKAFEHMSAGLKAPGVSCAPLAEKRDGLGFEDCQVVMPAGRLIGNGDIAVSANGGADQQDCLCISVRLTPL